MKALCLGGCGFVGRRFVRRLLNDGWEVDVIDDLSTGLAGPMWPAFLKPTLEQQERLQFHYNDVRASFRSGFLQPSAYDLIIHLAAVVGGRLKIEGDPLAVATDLAIDSDFWNWIVRDPPKKVIYFSSSAVYPVDLQTREQHTKLGEQWVSDARPIGRPDFTYGWSKLTGEYLAKQAVEKYGVDVAIYRPFSGYGEDQSLDYPFPSIIRRVVERQNPITIWGSGEQVRDFIYIEDVVDIVMATYDKLKPGETLNLGSGQGTSFQKLARLACNILRHDADIYVDPSKPEGVFYRVADIHKMSALKHPTVSLEEGIRCVADYIRYQLDGGDVLV